MGIEIERKYRVHNDGWRYNQDGSEIKGIHFRQGYLSSNKTATVRVRVEGDVAKLTVKGRTQGITRVEYEYEIPTCDASEMLNHLCVSPLIEKTRYRRQEGELLWEVDVFHGDNDGLIVAEVELETDQQTFTLPEWIAEEVSGDVRYYNENLAKMPYKNWP